MNEDEIHEVAKEFVIQLLVDGVEFLSIAEEYPEEDSVFHNAVNDKINWILSDLREDL